jgi:hypothetical protein
MIFSVGKIFLNIATRDRQGGAARENISKLVISEFQKQNVLVHLGTISCLSESHANFLHEKGHYF